MPHARRREPHALQWLILPWLICRCILNKERQAGEHCLDTSFRRHSHARTSDCWAFHGAWGTLRGALSWGAGFIALANLAPLSAWSETTLTLSASPEYQVNSNIYDLAPGVDAPGTTDSRHSDQYAVYRGAAQAAFLQDQQNFFLNLQGAEYRYQHFTILDHDEYTADGGWKWKLGTSLDGTLEVTRSRTELPFYYLLQIQAAAVLLTEQRETAALNYLFNPDWRLETTAYTRKVDAPLSDAEDLDLKETSGTAVLRYVRNAKFTGGIGVGYLSGEYGNGVGDLAPAYHQVSPQVVSTYTVSALSSFTGQLGYTRRSSALASDDVSTATGSLDFKRSLTGKTSIDLLASRLVSANITNTASEIDSIGSATVNWQATYKLALKLGYVFTIRYLPGQGQLPGENRTDHQQYTAFNLDYQILRWLTLSPYANVQSRSSNTLDGNYNATVYGIIVKAQWQK
jgi:hypothetical protein